MKHRTFPKEGVQKLKDTVKELRSQINKLEKENRFLMDEIQNVMKPQRSRKLHQDKPRDRNYDEWRKDFMKRMALEVFKKG